MHEIPHPARGMLLSARRKFPSAQHRHTSLPAPAPPEVEATATLLSHVRVRGDGDQHGEGSQQMVPAMQSDSSSGCLQS